LKQGISGVPHISICHIFRQINKKISIKGTVLLALGLEGGTFGSIGTILNFKIDLAFKK
jgi:hypothetical protein